MTGIGSKIKLEIGKRQCRIVIEQDRWIGSLLAFKEDGQNESIA